jgi:hypothetical protein
MVVNGWLLVLLDRMTGLGAVEQKNISPISSVAVQYIAYSLYQSMPGPLIYAFKTEFSGILKKVCNTLKFIKCSGNITNVSHTSTESDIADLTENIQSC